MISVLFEDVYAPKEDSYLIIDYFKKKITPSSFDGLKPQDVKYILDMGTGTGIIAIFLELMKKKYNNYTYKVFASDILPNAIICARHNAKLNNITGKITFMISDLFNAFPQKLRKKFDIVMFNPPYLPSIEMQEGNMNYKKDYTFDGGKKGYELFLKFLNQVKEYLNTSHKCYIYYICSSITNLDVLYEKILDLGYINTHLERIHFFFEDILLNRLEI